MDRDWINVRKPVFAGSFYPSSKEAVASFIGNLDAEDRPEKESFSGGKPQQVSGLIVPHAGWVYSGKTAMAAYRLLKGTLPGKIALLGPSHRLFLDTALGDDHDYWESPLGRTPVIHDPHFKNSAPSHAREHSLEVQLPFIQYFVPGCSILPLVVGQLSVGQPETLVKGLLENDYFLIISTDLSHFHSLEEANKRDLKSIKKIEAVQENGVEACGIDPLRIAFAFMRENGLRPHLIDYSTSANVSDDTSSVVGYASFWF